MIRIQASYPATDGSCPESIEIEWNDEAPPSPRDLVELIGALAHVPNARVIGTEPGAGRG
jgi:hypothetical protein